MVNLFAIFITVALITYLLTRGKSLIDFRLFALLYYLFFYELSFYSYYYLEQKIDFGFEDTIGPVNFLVIMGYLTAALFINMNLLGTFKTEVAYGYNPIKERGVTYAIVALLSVLMVIYYVKAGTFPIFLESVEDGRIELAGKAGGYVIILMQFIFILYVMLSAKAFVKKEYLKALIILALVIAFWLVMASKRPIGGLLIMFLIFYIYQKKRIPNSLIALSVFGILMVISVYGTYRFFGTVELEPMLKILMAIFNAEMFNISLILQDPPPQQWGQTYINAFLMFFEPIKDIGSILKEHYNLVFKGGGITIGIIGEGYINFGYIGIYVEAVIFWLCIIFLAKKMQEKAAQKEYLSIGKYAFYFYFLLWILRNGFLAVATPLLYLIAFEALMFFMRRRFYAHQTV